jgi:hypothetical protein
MLGMTQKRASRPAKLTLASLDERLRVLERERSARVGSPQWWIESAGRFKNDPVFAKIIELGRKERAASRPKRRKQSKRARP